VALLQLAEARSSCCVGDRVGVMGLSFAEEGRKEGCPIVESGEHESEGGCMAGRASRGTELSLSAAPTPVAIRLGIYLRDYCHQSIRGSAILELGTGIGKRTALLEAGCPAGPRSARGWVPACATQPCARERPVQAWVMFCSRLARHVAAPHGRLPYHSRLSTPALHPARATSPKQPATKLWSSCTFATMHPAILHEKWVKLKGASHAYRYMGPHATRLRTLALDLYSSSTPRLDARYLIAMALAGFPVESSGLSDIAI
jgi:hypothetical protein